MKQTFQMNQSAVRKYRPRHLKTKNLKLALTVSQYAQICAAANKDNQSLVQTVERLIQDGFKWRRSLELNLTTSAAKAGL